MKRMNDRNTNLQLIGRVQIFERAFDMTSQRIDNSIQVLVGNNSDRHAGCDLAWDDGGI
jgi:hypothetical protein